VTIVVPVFMTHCHVVAELEYRACDAQTTTIKAAAMNAPGWPVARAVHLAKREKGDEE
jgi:hypothetical protein